MITKEGTRDVISKEKPRKKNQKKRKKEKKKENDTSLTYQ